MSADVGANDAATAVIDPVGAVAVVTGGASGIGRAIARDLVGRGSTVVICDVEAAAAESTAADLAGAAGSSGGSVHAMVVDVTDAAAVDTAAQAVFDAHGRCDLLFLNAGVTSGGGGRIWEQDPNDWRWCFGVNVFGVANGIRAFVPRMIADGRPAQVVVTSSKDGGVAPIPTASVYASSKAALTCMTEALARNLGDDGTSVGASLFYPSGGLLDTGLYNSTRNRPADLARAGEGEQRAGMSFAQLKDRVAGLIGREPPVADLAELAAFVVDGAVQRRYLLAHQLDESAQLLHERADSVARGELPTRHRFSF